MSGSYLNYRLKIRQRGKRDFTGRQGKEVHNYSTVVVSNFQRGPLTGMMLVEEVG
jgi:hypothetical protein